MGQIDPNPEGAASRAPKKSVPALQFHAPSGRYYVWLGRRIYCGRDKAEADRRYRRLVQQLLAGGTAPPPAGPPAGAALTVAEALLRYMKAHALAYYADQPKTLARLWEMAAAVGRDHAADPADQFRGRQLKAVRAYLLGDARRCKHTGRPLSRTYVNYLVRAAQRCWTWLLSEGDASAECVASLRAVEMLHRGKGGRETRRVMPPPAGWDAALVELPPTLAAMVRVQQYGAMRPQDVCRMRRRDLSTGPGERVEFPGTGVFLTATAVGGAAVWAFVPSDHKTAHLGKPRAVALGLEAQRLLRPLLAGLAPDDYVFSPAKALAECGRGNRFKREGYARCYATGQYAQAVARATARVNARLVEAGVDPALHVPAWSPNQLRHLQATAIEDAFDREHARAALGHSSPDMTARYAEQSFAKAAAAAARCG